jgi:hypothetical protein
MVIAAAHYPCTGCTVYHITNVIILVLDKIGCFSNHPGHSTTQCSVVTDDQLGNRHLHRIVSSFFMFHAMAAFLSSSCSCSY